MITKEVFEEQKELSDRWKTMYYEKKNDLDELLKENSNKEKVIIKQ